MQTIKVIIDWDNNFGAASEDVPGCVATGKTIEAVKEAYISALKFHIEGSKKDELPKVLHNKYKLKFELSAQSILQSVDGIITRAALSRVTGINERQLGHYMTRHRAPKPEQRNKIVNGINNITNRLKEVV